MKRSKAGRYTGFRRPGIRLTEDPLPDILIHSSEHELPQLYACHMFDKAHLVMLAEEGIIPMKDAVLMLDRLRKMEAEGIEKSRLVGGGGIHSGEHYLINELGEEVGGKIHTGRSSGDLDKVADRVNQRENLLKIMDSVNSLREALLRAAAAHTDTVMPGYTHGQQAQPLTLGHQMLSWAAALSRDFDRLRSVFRRINVSPAGAAIMTGSGFPVNRQRTADLLGFERPSENTLDAVHGSDDLLEIFCALAVLHANLARWADDVILWSASETAMIDLPDRFCGTSSILPHKKNPYAMEHVRGAASHTVGGLMSAFHAEKGPTGMGVFSRNFYVKPALLRSFDNILRDLQWFTGLIPAMKVDKDRMEEMAGSFWATATEVAELIVREKGLSWRTAHQIVGILVRISRERGVAPTEVDTRLLDEAAEAYFQKPLHLNEGSLRKALDPVRFVKSRTLHGGPAPVESERRIHTFREALKRDRKVIFDMRRRLRKAAEELERAVEEIIRNPS
jgi:argininosuccinate lyase